MSTISEAEHKTRRLVSVSELPKYLSQRILEVLVWNVSQKSAPCYSGPSSGWVILRRLSWVATILNIWNEGNKSFEVDEVLEFQARLDIAPKLTASDW